jgi:stage II sporulation protein D
MGFPRFAREAGTAALCASLVLFAGCAGFRSLRVERDTGKGLSGRVEGKGSEHDRDGAGSSIRVGVSSGVHALRIASRDARIVSSGVNLPIRENAVLELHADTVTVNGTSLPLPASIESDHPLVLNGKTYTGKLVLREDSVVNILPLDDYLRGVVSSEMPKSWPLEALKAQVIVSRTYAVRKMRERKGEPFDLDDTEMYQKYDYVEKTLSIDAAIHSTDGLILIYQGDPIEAFFHANSGGVTESCPEIFQKDLPYLRGRKDPYTEGENAGQWTLSLRGEEIQRRLEGFRESRNTLYPTVPSAPISEIGIHSRTASGRVREFALTFGRAAGREKLIIKGNAFRLALDPKSFRSLLITGIEKTLQGSGFLFTFSGKGYGHGVGMSQVGAKEMADRGFGFREILSFYYQGAQVGRWDGR